MHADDALNCSLHLDCRNILFLLWNVDTESCRHARSFVIIIPAWSASFHIISSIRHFVEVHLKLSTVTRNAVGVNKRATGPPSILFIQTRMRHSTHAQVRLRAATRRAERRENWVTVMGHEWGCSYTLPLTIQYPNQVLYFVACITAFISTLLFAQNLMVKPLDIITNKTEKNYSFPWYE